MGSLLDAPSFSIRLLGATLNGGVQVNSGTCFFVLSSKSENYFELIRLLNILKENPLDESSANALNSISNLLVK